VTQKEKIRRIGLARALSKLGYCSRSQATELIRAGRVRLNGATRRDPETPVRLERDRIGVDGESVQPEEKIYLMMNKPRGLVTTASDEKGRETIYAILANAAAHDGHACGKALPWVAPVGRLDKASEGLLLLTNDSEWGARIADPRTHLEKTYHVHVDRIADHKLIQSFVSGIQCADGERLRARQARILRTGQKNCWLEIILDEGRNRQIRRMLAAHGLQVLRLVRVAIGPLQLGELAKGTYRSLTQEERCLLDCAMAERSA
jgi:23S rRNA pseudouridine2605 synthase